MYLKVVIEMFVQKKVLSSTDDVVVTDRRKCVVVARGGRFCVAYSCC